MLHSSTSVDRVPRVAMTILDLIHPQTIKAPLDAKDKRGAICELIDLLGQAGKLRDAEELKRVVLEREQQRSTGIGEGLAIPHGKSPTVRELVMAIGKPAQPIEFEAIDRKPVRLIILLASPPEKTSDHIQALGKISRLMSKVEFREAAYAAQSAHDLQSLFEEAEKPVAAR
jgi:fructose-specific phosphotransferase system IIA component